MPQFVKYTKEFHELIKKTNQLVNKTDITGEEGGSNGRKTTIVEETASGTGVYEYDGMFCIRLVKKTEKEINPDTGEEEDVENTYVCVTDGRSQDPFANTSNDYAGFCYLNGLPWAVSRKAEKINATEADNGKMVALVFLKYTLNHSAYTDKGANYPAETEKLECVILPVTQDNPSSQYAEITYNGQTVSLPIRDKYHSFFLLGRVYQDTSGKIGVRQDSHGCPNMSFHVYLALPSNIAVQR